MDAVTPRPDATPALDPAAALRPGARDAGALWGLWLARRSFTWLLLLGIAVGTVLAEVDHDDAELLIDTSSARTVLSGLVSRFGLVFVALIVRFATGWAALVLAYPAARAHQRDLGLPAHSPRRVATHLDRLRVTRALRELRWTLGVRSAAIDRLGDRRRLVTRLDRAVGIANVAAGVVCALAIVGFGATVQV